IGARDRLMPSDQVEHNAPIDIARRLARRHLEVGQIYLPHPNLQPRARPPLSFNSSRELYHATIVLTIVFFDGCPKRESAGACQSPRAPEILKAVRSDVEIERKFQWVWPHPQ